MSSRWIIVPILLVLGMFFLSGLFFMNWDDNPVSLENKFNAIGGVLVFIFLVLGLLILTSKPGKNK